MLWGAKELVFADGECDAVAEFGPLSFVAFRDDDAALVRIRPALSGPHRHRAGAHARPPGATARDGGGCAPHRAFGEAPARRWRRDRRRSTLGAPSTNGTGRALSSRRRPPEPEVATAMELRTLAEGLQFPEGPVALRRRLGDPGRDRRRRIDPGRRPTAAKTIVAEPGGGPNGAAVGPDGKGYVANNGGFEWAVDDQGRRRPLTQANDYSGGRLERVDLADRRGRGAVPRVRRTSSCTGRTTSSSTRTAASISPISANGGARDMDVGARLLRQARRLARSSRSPIRW